MKHDVGMKAPSPIPPPIENPALVEVFKDDNGKEVGATLAFTRVLDGDHDYGETHIVDKLGGGVTGYVAWGYEIDTDYYIDD